MYQIKCIQKYTIAQVVKMSGFTALVLKNWECARGNFFLSWLCNNYCKPVNNRYIYAAAPTH